MRASRMRGIGLAANGVGNGLKEIDRVGDGTSRGGLGAIPARGACREKHVATVEDCVDRGGGPDQHCEIARVKRRPS